MILLSFTVILMLAMIILACLVSARHPRGLVYDEQHWSQYDEFVAVLFLIDSIGFFISTLILWKEIRDK